MDKAVVGRREELLGDWPRRVPVTRILQRKRGKDVLTVSCGQIHCRVAK